MKPKRWASLAGGGALAAAALVAGPFAGLAAPATAAGGSTPGVTVTATNPSETQLGSDMKLALTAHSEPSTVTDPSCRPEDTTLQCWGSLVLRLPKFGDVSVGEFQVHRVAVGDTTCGDMGGGCGDEAQPALASSEPVDVQVNGVAFVKWSGNSGLAVGTKVQLKFTLTDNGRAPYADQVVVQMNRFVEGPDKPLLYQSGLETIRQVQVQFDNTQG
jgi:hypothetical protein